MSMNEHQLDHLFEQARSQKPEASFEETKRAFVTAAIIGAGGVLATKGLLKLLTIKKGIIMISVASILTTTSIIVATTTTTVPTAQTPPAESEAVPAMVQAEPKIQNQPQVAARLNPQPDEKTLTVLAVNAEELPVDDTLPIAAHAVAQPPAPTALAGVALPTNSPIMRPATKGLQTLCAEIEPYDMRFIITENTTSADFDAIAKKAETAGIAFKAKPKYKNDKLVHLRLTMKLDAKDEGSQYVSSTFDIEGEFEYQVAWNIADDGKAEYIYCGEKQENRADRSELNEEFFEFDDCFAARMDRLGEAFEKADWSYFDAFEESADEFGEAFEVYFNEGYFEKFEDEMEALQDDIEEAIEKCEQNLMNREEMEEEVGKATEALERLIELEMREVEAEMLRIEQKMLEKEAELKRLEQERKRASEKQ